MPNRQPSFQPLEKDQTWRLGLLVAPEGSGKTRFLRLWAQQRVKRSGIPVAWLSLRTAHNRPERFWEDLCTALNAAGLSFQPTEESSISNDPPFNLEERLISLVNALADRPLPLTTILDGYEAIEADQIHQAVRLLIDNLPAQTQVVIAARTSPPLQQARLRVRRELVELGQADLGDQAG